MIRENFKKIPEPLQKEILKRIGYSTLVIAVSLILILTTNDWILSVPCLFISLYLCITAITLYINSVKGKIICITGICVEIERSRFKRNGKSISLDVEGKCVKLPFKRRIKGVQEGSTVSVYMNEKTKVYNNQLGFVICDYYILELEKR